MMAKTMDRDKTCKNIQDLCKHRGVTVDQISLRLNISKQTVYYWFSTRKMPSIDHIVELSDILDTPIDDMIVRKDYRCET